MTFNDVNIIIRNIFIILLAILVFILLADLIINISNYFKEKRNYQYMINNKEMDNESKISTVDRLDATFELLNLINTLIDNEISKTLQACIQLRTKYEVTRLDKDVKVIATTVYTSIKPEVYLSKDLIITETFMMQHIMDEVMLRLLKAGQEYNEALKML